MKRLVVSLLSLVALAVSLNTANAWHVSGRVVCDSDQDGAIDSDDIALRGVVVIVVPESGPPITGVTDEDGFYFITLPETPASYVETLDLQTLPVNPTFVIPASGEYDFTLTEDEAVFEGADWLVQSPACGAACWLTGGGVKFEPIVGLRLAEGVARGKKGGNVVADTFGGNVNPGCSPTAGQGGQWNHVNHILRLHFQGFAIQVVDCGNVEGIPPGSESPKTPFNFIEFEGTGRLKGIKGNKVDFPEVNFFARCEDRNEPGSNGAKDGALIDRYFLHVFDDDGNTLLLFDLDGDPDTVDPVPITGGNLQIDISGCDNPPPF